MATLIIAVVHNVDLQEDGMYYRMTISAVDRSGLSHLQGNRSTGVGMISHGPVAPGTRISVTTNNLIATVKTAANTLFGTVFGAGDDVQLFLPGDQIT